MHQHPRQSFKKIGFWYSTYEPDLPKPQEYIDWKWDPHERILIANWLKAGQVVASYRGMSTCRVCNIHNGHQDITDGTYVWPSGYVHYIESHGVKPPQEFIDHVKRKMAEFAR